MSGDSPIGNFGRTVAYYKGVSNEGLVANSGPFARYAQRSA
ncbi:hypothetical protein X747_32990 [Mesorhizobium sp. LNJC384A00]|nr:hypothetical protein X772_29420 [Mesorhizobium sp. LSJC280B00]ESX76085.1 hypothetical protein X757_16840 [Mesorhizobium sp. LSHC414A00]ESY27385.1 hypothetical protein X747_32990 [Mesorhizobium sp. LNJC384A00]